MHLEKPGTWQHGVSACKGVDLLGNEQSPPEHVDVVGGSSSQVGRGVLQNCMHFRRGGLTEIDAL